VAHKAAADGVEFGHGRPNSLSSKAALTLSVFGYKPYSLPEIYGFEIGDIILTYGGVQIFSWLDFASKSITRNDGGFITVQVDRHGNIVELNIPPGLLNIELEPALYKRSSRNQDA